MQTLHFSISIKAPKEKVWHTMLDQATYREWTTAFSPGSYFKGSWDQGSKIVFIGPDPNTGQEAGMVSRIAENRLYEFVSIKHVGIISNGLEDLDSPAARKWTPAFENYTFIDQDGTTEVKVDLDVLPEHAKMFDATWPAALQKLKELAEK